MNTVKMSRRAIIRGLATGSVVALAPGCAENAALGRNQLMLVSDSQIQQLSAQAWQQTLQEQPISRDRVLNERLQRVGRRIVPVTGMQNLAWEFVVIDDPVENAFVLPGGKVAFYRGILESMRNDDQIATVMGHEAAHLAGRHAAERASQQQAAGLGMGIASVALGGESGQVDDRWAAVLGAGVTFGVLLPYSRRHELEADRIGVDYMHAANYNVREALSFWEAKAAGSQSSQPEFASTHPSDSTRISALRQHMQSRGYI